MDIFLLWVPADFRLVLLFFFVTPYFIILIYDNNTNNNKSLQIFGLSIPSTL